jgi:exodeoxyribonuclease III
VKIATWNVNSVKARLPHLLRWLEEAKPDVLLLQEIKIQEADFPHLELIPTGYRCELVGQKSYNGVAIVSRLPIEPVLRALPGSPEDDHARYLEADVGGVRVASIYLPNGNPVGTDKYPYKLGWMERLRARAEELMALEGPLVLGGDYNICPGDDDLYDPLGWRDDALCRPESRARFRALVNLGFTDAVRVFHTGSRVYSFWDYQAGRWQRDEGLRIDHLLLSPEAADRLKDAGVDKSPRAWDRASDHTPVWCELAD